ncbi:MAG: hypothetical protein JHC38_06175 [Thiotrichales bacterium]|jgi:hypothetical protein|nr:hypothetical protein [Thiotrichales bacterium]
MNSLSTKDQTTEFLLYTSPNGQVKVEVLLNNETLWLFPKWNLPRNAFNKSEVEWH